MSPCKAIINAILTPIVQLTHVAAANPKNPKRCSHLAHSGLKQNEARWNQTNSQACVDDDDDARTCGKWPPRCSPALRVDRNSMCKMVWRSGERERGGSEERGTKGAANETEAENSALLNQAWRVYNGHCIKKSSYTGLYST